MQAGDRTALCGKRWRLPPRYADDSGVCLRPRRATNCVRPKSCAPPLPTSPASATADRLELVTLLRQNLVALAALLLCVLFAPIRTAAMIPHSAPLASSQSALDQSSPAAVLTLSDAAVSGMCRNDPVNNFDPLGLEPALCYDPATGKAGCFDTYDIHYLGWDRAVNRSEMVPRFDPTIPLGDRPYDFLRGESLRMQFGEGMANAVSALPETLFMLGQGGKIVVGAVIVAGDPSCLVKGFGAGLVFDGLDELQGYTRGTDPYFVQGLKGLGLDERDVARVQFVKGAGQTAVLLAFAIPQAHQPIAWSAQLRGAASRINLTGRGNIPGLYAMRSSEASGFYDVIAHGDPLAIEAVGAGGKIHSIRPEVLVRYLQRFSRYNGQNIRLLSCRTGAMPGGFAQGTSDAAGVFVSAPDEYLWATPRGRIFVSGEITDPVTGASRPVVPPTGRFVSFGPGGK